MTLSLLSRFGIGTHPAERRLHQYADDELSRTQRQQIAGHLLECSACRAVVSSVRALGHAARQQQELAPDLAAMRAQVIGRRGGGERVILTASADRGDDANTLPAFARSRSPRSQRAWPGLAVAGLIGALAGASVASLVSRSAKQAEATAAGTAPAVQYSALDVGVGDGAFCLAGIPDGGHAVIDVSAVEGAALRRLLADAGLAAALIPFVDCRTEMPAFPPVVAFDASRVRPMTLSYHSRTVVDTVAIESYDRTLTLERSTLGGQVAWVVMGHTDKYPLVTNSSDSLYLSATNLRPLRQIIAGSHGARHLRIEINGDAGVMHLDGYHDRTTTDTIFARPVVLVHQTGATLGPAPLDVILPSLPLHSGWTGSVNVLASQCLICSMNSVGWPGQSFTNPSLVESLRVEGTDHITGPAGAADCWRIRVSGGALEGTAASGTHIIWVSQDAHIIVKDVVTWTDSDGIIYQRTRELTRQVLSR